MTNSRIVLPVLALSAMLAVYRGSAAPPRLQYVTTAHQAGPVGYRDPVGAVSPDGVWLAYVVESASVPPPHRRFVDHRAAPGG